MRWIHEVDILNIICDPEKYPNIIMMIKSPESSIKIVSDHPELIRLMPEHLMSEIFVLSILMRNPDLVEFIPQKFEKLVMTIDKIN